MPRSPRTGVRSRSIRATPTPTAISACCCGQPDSRWRRKPHIGPLSGWILNTSTRTPTSGFCFNGLQRTEEAAACYCKVITLRPKHREARKLLALAHCMLGEIGKAVTIFEEWLEQEPEDTDRAAHAGRLHRSRRAGRASDGFVADHLRQFRVQLRGEAQDAGVSAARPRWSRPCWRMPALSIRIVSTCWTRDAAPGSAARWSRRLRAGSPAWTCPQGCWLTPRTSTSTTRW